MIRRILFTVIDIIAMAVVGLVVGSAYEPWLGFGAGVCVGVYGLVFFVDGAKR